MKWLISFLLWLWQFPQNLCGIIYRSISKDNRICVIENNDSRSVGAKVYLQKTKGGISLGKYIFINQDYIDKEIVIKHECGHVKQSKNLVLYIYWLLVFPLYYMLGLIIILDVVGRMENIIIIIFILKNGLIR